MKRMPLAITSFVLLSLAALRSPAGGAEPPKLLYLSLNRELQKAESPKTAPVYVKKDTWHETLSASLEATLGPTVKEDRAARPAIFAAIVRLTADGQPVRLELRVEGFERLYFATLGRQSENGSAQYLSPRLFDKQGNFIELKLDSTMVEGRIDPRAARATKLKFDGTTHRGFALSPGEIGFRLDGKYERLEVLVYYQRERGLPPHAAVDCRPIVARAAECRQAHETLFDLVARDFRDRQSQIEMEMERGDGIWSEYAPTWNGVPDAYYLTRARQRLELARKTLDFVEQTAPQPKMATELQTLEQRVDRHAEDPVSSAGRDLFAQAVDLRRRIIFSHPAPRFRSAAC